MTSIGEIKVVLDATALQQTIDAAIRSIREVGQQQQPTGVTGLALAAAAASGSVRKVSRRALLGLGWRWR